MMVRINGLIQPKGRPRFARRGAYVKTYTPKATKDSEEYIRAEYLRQTRQKQPLEGAVNVCIEFHYAPPKGTSKTQTVEMLMGKIHRTKKPDIDNLEKTILDALNGVAWVDDKQIIELHAIKKYDSQDYTIIYVEAV